MKTSKESHVLTRVGTKASKWELNTISLKSSFGVVMFAKEVPLRSCAIDFPIYTICLYP
jgi:hypothetical protein